MPEIRIEEDYQGELALQETMYTKPLKVLGVTGLHDRKDVRNITEATERTSRQLWIKRRRIPGIPVHKL